jgi:hypothetical protein
MEITRPARPADYYGPKGSEFWFKEMIYQGAAGRLHKLETDPKDNRLFSTRYMTRVEAANSSPLSNTCRGGSFQQCDRCANEMVCDSYCFQDHVQDKYEEYVTRSLENILLGANDGIS